MKYYRRFRDFAMDRCSCGRWREHQMVAATVWALYLRAHLAKVSAYVFPDRWDVDRRVRPITDGPPPVILADAIAMARARAAAREDCAR